MIEVDTTWSARPGSSDGETGWVHSPDLSIGVDGPGTRLVVFVTGCPMRCLYCHNPDTWPRLGGEETALADIKRLMTRYRGFIEAAGGGFTVPGGEPLEQAAFTRRMLRAAKRAGLHTALDTSGFLGRRADADLLEATDLVLLDIKAGTDAGHRRLTGRPIGPTLQFARRLAAQAQRAWVRYVLVPGQLGIAFPLADNPLPSAELVASVRAQMRARGLPVASAARRPPSIRCSSPVPQLGACPT
jgi:pyruvate formate lyase activating enzyme